MALTIEEINLALEEFYKNPNQSVRLADGRQYTRHSIDDLLKLRSALKAEAQAGTAKARKLIPVRLKRK